MLVAFLCGLVFVLVSVEMRPKVQALVIIGLMIALAV
jgi:hypothetical protein